MPSIQKQISLIFNKKKQQIFVDYFTYQRIRTQVFNYPKKYQNNFTYYIDLDNNLYKIIYVFLTIFLYLLKCPQSLILSALRAFCFCGKPHISRSIFLYFRYQAWLKSW